jgi:hypothetical protein
MKDAHFTRDPADTSRLPQPPADRLTAGPVFEGMVRQADPDLLQEPEADPQTSPADVPAARHIGRLAAEKADITPQPVEPSQTGHEPDLDANGPVEAKAMHEVEPTALPANPGGGGRKPPGDNPRGRSGDMPDEEPSDRNEGNEGSERSEGHDTNAEPVDTPGVLGPVRDASQLVDIQTFSTEFFIDADKMALMNFDDAVTEVSQMGSPPLVQEVRYVEHIFGGSDNKHIHVSCAYEQGHDLSTDTYTQMGGVSVHLRGEESTDGTMLTRSLINGEIVEGGLSQADQATLLEQVRAKVHPATWQWLQDVLQVASGQQTLEGKNATDLTARHEMIDKLLTDPPVHDIAMREVEIRHQEFEFLGMSVTIHDEMPNAAYVMDRDSGYVKCEVKVHVPGDGEYIYHRMGDNTDQMVLRTRTELQRQRMINRGLPATTSDVWDVLTPAQRWDGMLVPSKRMTGRFTALLHDIVDQAKGENK